MKSRGLINMKCLECAGNVKEVTLCHLFDCPQWEFRCGYSTNDKRYKKKVNSARRLIHVSS